MIKKNLLILFSFFFIYLNTVKSAETDIYQKIDLFGEVLEKINKEYVDEINQSESMDSAINGLLQSLDPYSAYMSPEIFNEMQTETSGEFGGLGIEVGMESGVVKVISPIDDTPASRAGIKAGDYIVKIDNIQVQGKSLSEAVDLMRGPVGSGIELTVRRRGEKKALIFKVTREIIEIKSVKAELLDQSIGYLRLTSFNENSSKSTPIDVTRYSLHTSMLETRFGPEDSHIVSPSRDQRERPPDQSPAIMDSSSICIEEILSGRDLTIHALDVASNSTPRSFMMAPPQSCE